MNEGVYEMCEGDCCVKTGVSELVGEVTTRLLHISSVLLITVFTKIWLSGK